MDKDQFESVKVERSGIILHGFLECPAQARGMVLFAHGSGSGRMSPRNQRVARYLNERGLATLLLDLLTDDEEDLDHKTGELRFNIGFLARRLLLATDWIQHHPLGQNLGLGYFGASTGAAAALVAAAIQPEVIQAVVSRGGRPDLAAPYLESVRSPTLLIVGSLDHPVVDMNREAMEHMKKAPCTMEIVPGATHLFEEPGTLARVAELSAEWFTQYLHRRHDAVSHHV
ncbi:MAG TPA: dienelactone hydrolase family protein [Oligoflexus sp.]|uniref:dienelactone hydrolase family protein n=1 Tax=Oligoflexus sp. TaxID=1971216 RepID=UPI002D7EE438|nr:dienelactone hydrolase family protein [Oligoflexus sp.]HET9235621.1 dienelactone hydrolase family protein [Oligoflexus sp.]